MAKNLSPRSIFGYMFRLWKLAPALLTIQAIFQVAFTMLGVAIAPIFVSKLLSSIANGTATIDNSLWLLLVYFCILFMASVVSPRISIAAAYIGTCRIQMRVAEDILIHLTRKSLGYHANKMSGGTVSNSTKLIGAIERFWDTMMWTVIPTVVAIVSVCIALSFMIWQYALVIAVLSIIFTVLAIKAQMSISKKSEEVAIKSSKLTAFLADVVTNISAVKSFSRSNSEIETYRKKNLSWFDSNKKEMKSVLFSTGMFSVVTTTLNTCAFFAAILATEYHIANIGVIYLMVSYTLSVTMRLWDISNATRNLIRVIGDASPMINTLAEDIEVKDPEKPNKLVVSEGRITFENVSFIHDEASTPLFSNFSLKINPGEHVGIVGRSGSGKTSLTRILLRFSDIQHGQITIDGQDITSVTQDDLHHAIAYVPQDPALFHRSLNENISYGNPDASKEEIIEAAQKARAFEFINILPKKFDTLVGERGIKLSGGQRQRVAIARAILKNAPILVLDEATSALDSETESLIQEALTELMMNRTSIVIAHRLSTIAKLDRIIVLDEGKIVEQGSHKELIEKDGVYAMLWKHQSGGFIEE